MNEVSYRMAIYLFKSNQEVFLLYGDGNEAVATSVEELTTHYDKAGIFGIEK